MVAPSPHSQLWRWEVEKTLNTLIAGGGGGGGGITDAPPDGKDYVRNMNAWVALNWASLDNVPATFPPTLPIAQAGITNLVTDLSAKAPLASPALTGTPTAPTVATGDNSISIATTAFVKAQGYALSSAIPGPYTTNPAMNGTASPGASALFSRGDHVHPVDTSREAAANKGVANGYASLDATAKVPAAQLPSYVDDVLEFANLAAFPATGTAGVIYVALDTGKIYRWSGSAYVEISPSPGSTDAVPEGISNLYYTNARASAAAPVQSVAGRTGAVTLTKADVGLGNVDNTSDANKPVSTATATALGLKADLAGPVFTGDARAVTAAPGDNDTSIATTAFVTTALTNAAVPAPATVAPLMDGTAAVGTTTKYAREDHKHPTDTSREPTLAAGTTAQYYRGDKTWVAFPAFEPPISAGLTTQYWRGDKTWVVLDKTAVGLGNVANTAQVTSVSGTAPVVSSGGTTPAISMPPATNLADGYLKATDWVIFNAKGSGTVTSVTGTAPVVSSGGNTPAISMAAANGSTNGYLSSSDWTTFNNKASAASVPAPSSTLPVMDGTATIGVGTTYARHDHIHPTDTSREPTLAVGTTAQYYRGDKSWQTLNAAAVGLGNVANTAQVTSVTGTAPVVSSGGTTPAISMAAATSSVNGYLTSADWVTFNGKEPAISVGTTAQYRRGDKTWQTLDKAAVGLANVDNTSDVNKPVSSATQTALNGKEATITAGLASQYWRGDKTWQTLDKTAVGLGNVDNTSDANKPVSTAQAAADATKEPVIAAGLTTQYWRGDKTWQTLPTGNSAAAVTVSDTTPFGPVQGQLWLESDTGNMFAWWDDGTSGQWVQVNVPANAADFVKKIGDTMTGDLNGTNLSMSGTVTAGQIFQASSGSVVLGTTGAANIYLRPSGAGNTAGQAILGSAGTLTTTNWLVSPVATVGGQFAGTSFANSGEGGLLRSDGCLLTKCTPTTTFTHHAFFNGASFGGSAGTQVGSIATSGSATAYNTSSDERLKDFGDAMTMDEAFAVINADPVRHFVWKKDGVEAVGWGAQTSYSVSPDLATPGTGDPGDEDFQPWATDQAKRTPYLWAAVSGLLKRIEELEARLAVLEAA